MLIKENDKIINEIKLYNKKNDDLKKEINKLENISNQFLFDVQGLIKISNSK